MSAAATPRDTPSVHVTRWGTAGPRVVMVHGSAQGSRIGGSGHFSEQRRLADAGWQLLVPDRPGHGLSGDPGRPDDAAIDGEWVADLLGDGAHLVGHSFGGCVALAAAAGRPDAVRSLTLIEPAMLKLSTTNPDVRKFGLRLLMATQLSFGAAGRARKVSALLGIPEDVRGGTDERELKRMGRAIKRLKVPSGETLRGELARIRAAGVPLLVVTGGWNAAFEASSDEVAALGAGRRLVIPSPHHFPQKVSDAFNVALIAFMEEAEQTRASA